MASSTTLMPNQRESELFQSSPCHYVFKTFKLVTECTCLRGEDYYCNSRL